jgi:hypothetical protein
MITKKTVTDVWQLHAQLDFFAVEKQIAGFSKEQPVLVSYLMSANEEFYNFEEKQLLLYIGVAIWQMFRRGGGAPLKWVSDDLLQQKQQENINMIEYLEGEMKEDFARTVSSIMENYRQKHILQHVFNAVFDASLDKSRIRVQNKGLLFFDLKTLMDCLDQ